MSPTTQGFVVLVVTLGMLLSGIPVAFGLGAISIIFLLIFQGFDSMRIVAETYEASRHDAGEARQKRDGPNVSVHRREFFN